MTTEKFNWKGLFINDEGDADDNTPEKKEEERTTFPDAEKVKTTFSGQTPKSSVVGSNVLNTIIEMYEAGFDSLNQPGYDFFEFFKAIKAVGSTEPQVYKMALTMAQGVDPKVTKTTLLHQAEFYLKEINKVHEQYKAQGSSKKNSIQEVNKAKKISLSNDISELERKILDLQNQVSIKKNQLQSIDVNQSTEVKEIDEKLLANDMAKTKILQSINTVVEGVKNYL